jgi:hypothetical protein
MRTNVVVGRERILQSLNNSVQEIDTYVVDQYHYLENHLKAHELEQNGSYFWIFRGLDYRRWSDLKANVKVLVLCDSSILEHAASYIIHTLRETSNIQADDMLLYFFYSSMRYEGRPPKWSKAADSDNFVFLYTLLRQVIDNHHQLPIDSTEAFKLLSRLLTLESLWDAFVLERQRNYTDAMSIWSDRNGIWHSFSISTVSASVET